MTIFLALLFLAAGVALVVNTVMSPISPDQVFLRHGAPDVRSRRIWPMTMGALITLGGVALLLL